MAEHMTAEQLRAELEKLAHKMAEFRCAGSSMCASSVHMYMGQFAEQAKALAARLSGMAAAEGAQTRTQFKVQMACGKDARHGWASISRFDTEALARDKMGRLALYSPEDSWRVVRVDETRTVVCASPEPPHG